MKSCLSSETYQLYRFFRRQLTLYTTLLKPETILEKFDIHKLLYFCPDAEIKNSSWECLQLINHTGNTALVFFFSFFCFLVVSGHHMNPTSSHELFICWDTQLMSKAHAAWAVCSMVSWSKQTAFGMGASNLVSTSYKYNCRIDFGVQILKTIISEIAIRSSKKFQIHHHHHHHHHHHIIMLFWGVHQIKSKHAWDLQRPPRSAQHCML